MTDGTYTSLDFAEGQARSPFFESLTRCTKVLLIATFLSVSQATNAGNYPGWVSIGAISYHLDRDEPHNEINGGLGLEYQFNLRHSFALLRYENSHYRISNLAYYAWTPIARQNFTIGPLRSGQARLGVLIGAVSGYRSHGSSLSPIALPLMALEWRHIGLNITGLPTVGRADGAIAVQFKIRL
jgi:hypothetical protein